MLHLNTTKLNFKQIILYILTAITLFLSSSFIQFLAYTNPFYHFSKDEYYLLKIGFPFTYYEQFWVCGNSFPNTSWDVHSLIKDGLFFTIVTSLFFVLNNRFKKA